MKEDEIKLRELLNTKVKELSEYSKHTIFLLKQFNKIFGDENRFINKSTINAIESLVDMQIMLGIQSQINQLILEKNQYEESKKQINEVPSNEATKQEEKEDSTNEKMAE